MMTLREYLETENITSADFAEQISITVAALHRYMNGDRIPSRTIMPLIKAATDGKVTADSFYPDQNKAA